MRVFLTIKHRTGPAEIYQERVKDNARQWKSLTVGIRQPYTGESDIYIGKGRIFIDPSEKIDGYELTEEDLRSLLDQLQKQKQPNAD